MPESSRPALLELSTPSRRTIDRDYQFKLIKHPQVAGAPQVRTIELCSGGQTIGRAIWSSSMDSQGHVQLLHLEVSEKHRRQGHGQAIVREVRRLADIDLRAGGFRLRRMTVEVRQKSQVIARAFFTRMGFHHVTTLKHVIHDEDLLVYLWSGD